MPFSTKDLLVVAVQGEGDRDKAREVAEEDRLIKLNGLTQRIPGRPARDIPADVMAPADPDPDVTLILRDPLAPDQPCVQLMLRSWEEVDGFKASQNGQHWDDVRKQFIFAKFDPSQGRLVPFGTVKVSFE